MADVFAGYFNGIICLIKAKAPKGVQGKESITSVRYSVTDRQICHSGHRLGEPRDAKQ